MHCSIPASAENRGITSQGKFLSEQEQCGVEMGGTTPGTSIVLTLRTNPNYSCCAWAVLMGRGWGILYSSLSLPRNRYGKYNFNGPAQLGLGEEAEMVGGQGGEVEQYVKEDHTKEVEVCFVLHLPSVLGPNWAVGAEGVNWLCIHVKSSLFSSSCQVTSCSLLFQNKYHSKNQSSGKVFHDLWFHGGDFKKLMESLEPV